MGQVPGATIPFAPFSYPVPPPAPLWNDAPLVCLTLNETWMTYLIGCAQALLAASSYDSDDVVLVNSVIGQARKLVNAMMDFGACEVISFRVNPTYVQNWQYSTDAGVTWLDGPDTASSFTPDFPVSGTAPSGFALSVNGGHSTTDIPLITANDPDAVIVDPVTATRNLITAGVGGAEGLLIGVLAHIGVELVKSNGIALALNKIPAFGLATSVLESLAAGTDYTYDLLAVFTP